MFSPPRFPAPHPPLFHAYTFSRADSFVQRHAFHGPACCQVTPLHPTALGNKRSCVHPTATWPSVIHQVCTPPLHSIPYQHSLPRMACSAWVVLLHNSLLLPHFFVAYADNHSLHRLVIPSPPRLSLICVVIHAHLLLCMLLSFVRVLRWHRWRCLAVWAWTPWCRCPPSRPAVGEELAWRRAPPWACW